MAYIHPAFAAAVAAGLSSLAGCNNSSGFTLPEGDVEAGQVAFLELGCPSCHTVAGLDLAVANGSSPEMEIELGGMQPKRMTYAELVTSVINPSHKLSRSSFDPITDDTGQSLMPSLNDEMTVAQLVDIVTFLESQYELVPFTPTYYPIY